MPTLVDDTIEFQASTLNDLLEADARSVAAPSAGEGKYRSWAFLSTAAAGLLALLLVVSLVTDSGKSKGPGGAGGSASTKKYPGVTGNVAVKVASIPTDVVADQYVQVSDPKSGAVVLAAVPVARTIPAKGSSNLFNSIELALTDAQAETLTKAVKVDEKVRVKRVDAPAPSTTPATAAPASPPAESTPPASTTPDSAPPAQTPPPSG